MLKGKIAKEMNLSTWAEFIEGFEVKIRYVHLRELQVLRARCTEFTFDKKTHQRQEKIDEEQFDRALAEAAVMDWRGLTPDVLRTMVVMEDYPEADVPFSIDDCVELMRHAYGFSNFLYVTASELSMHEAARKAAQGNALPPASSNS